jgi:hypothetical protein
MRFRLGVLLILLSFLPWLLLPLAAWLATTGVKKAAWTAGLIVLGESLFWPGVLLAGREVWVSAKKRGLKSGVIELFQKLR